MNESFIDRLITYLQGSKTASLVILYVVAVALLNVAKYVLVKRMAIKEAGDGPCRYLEKKNGEQSCKHKSHSERFIALNGSCEACFGRTTVLQWDELEDRTKAGDRFSYLVVMLADAGRTTLPYVSILYTLLSAVAASQVQ